MVVGVAMEVILPSTLLWPGCRRPSCAIAVASLSRKIRFRRKLVRVREKGSLQLTSIALRLSLRPKFHLNEFAAQT